MAQYTGKAHTIRIYDGTAVTPQFIDLLGIETPNFSGAMGRALPDEEVILEKGALGNVIGRAPVSDASLVSAIALTINALLTEENALNFLPALSNPFNDSPWTVGGGTFVEVDQTGLQIPDSSGTLQSFPPFTSTLYNLVHIEVLLDATTDLMFRYEGVFFPADQIQMTLDVGRVNLTAQGACWGRVSRTNAHTAGTDITT